VPDVPDHVVQTAVQEVSSAFSKLLKRPRRGAAPQYPPAEAAAQGRDAAGDYTAGDYAARDYATASLGHGSSATMGSLGVDGAAIQLALAILHANLRGPRSAEVQRGLADLTSRMGALPAAEPYVEVAASDSSRAQPSLQAAYPQQQQRQQQQELSSAEPTGQSGLTSFQQQLAALGVLPTPSEEGQ